MAWPSTAPVAAPGPCFHSDTRCGGIRGKVNLPPDRFCKGGLHEVQVTTRSWIVGLVLAAVAVWSFMQGGFGHTGP